MLEFRLLNFRNVGMRGFTIGNYFNAGFRRIYMLGFRISRLTNVRLRGFANGTRCSSRFQDGEMIEFRTLSLGHFRIGGVQIQKCCPSKFRDDEIFQFSPLAIDSDRQYPVFGCKQPKYGILLLVTFDFSLSPKCFATRYDQFCVFC